MPKKTESNTQSIPSLFLTEIGVCRKSRLKDAWGNTAFLIKGKMPAWVKDVQVEEIDCRAYMKYTLAEIVKKKTDIDGKFEKIVDISPVAVMYDNVVYIIVRLATQAGEVVYMQRAFFDYIQQEYPAAILYLHSPIKDLPLIIAKVEDEIVAFVAGVYLDNVRILSAEELIRVYKEWSNDAKGVNLSNYKQTNG
jgi:hypothetical protein